MKKIRNKIVAILASVACIAALIPAVPAMADGQKVVTLGADLSEDQQIMMLEYFGVYGEPVETLFINNTEEREHLAAYVPIEQIGTRTVSCAMVNPTTSGGIQVKTANLTWVTGSMIAQTLSTSGVKNCEVIAAAPFAVSGTGALTGIMMAYETASGEELDEAKKDAATEELVATATIAGDIGQETAIQIVNDTKVEVVESGATTDEIQGIIDDAAQNLQVSLTPEDRELLTDLLNKLSDIDYDEDEIDAMKGETGNDTVDEDDNSDSILNNTDDSALGDDVVTTDTTTTDEDNNDEEAAGSEEDNDGFETFYPDETEGTTEEQPSEGTTENPDEGTIENPDEGTIENPDEGTTENPDEGTIENPDEGTTENPDEGTTENPDEGTSDEFPVSELVLTPNVTKGEIDMGVLPEEVSETAAPGLNCLTVQSSMELVAGSGFISVYDADNDAAPIATIQMNDDQRVVSEAITDVTELQELEWDAGIEFRIILDDPLEPGKSYYVVLSEDAFETADGTMKSAASEEGDWTFDTAEYGISVVETVDGVKVNEAATANLYMDPEAAYADVVYILSDGITEVYVGQYYEGGQIEVTFDQTGEITVKATYYAGDANAEGEPEVSEVSDGIEGLSDFVESEDVETFDAGADDGAISEAEYTVIVSQ